MRTTYPFRVTQTLLSLQDEAINLDDLTELAGMVAGPPDTPYSGGKYKLEIKIPDTYPFSPPKVTT